MASTLSDPTESLKLRYSEGKLHHAALIVGNTILSTEDAALNLTRAILSIPEDSDDHPDLFHLRPSGKARIITVEKTRALISNLYRTSNQGGSKVAIIHEADRMRKEAANAFLKTLEEPPPGTYLLLLTTRPYSLLATIRSRCLQARLAAESGAESSEVWENWVSVYRSWIHTLLDREKLKQDRISPLFTAYGLTSSLLSIIKQKADTEYKEAKDKLIGLDDKERDAYEAGLRKGARANLLRQLSDVTCSIALDCMKQGNQVKIGNKLSKVIRSLEKNVGLLEVNLKDEAAFEDFYLSSLRIWSSQ
jgi:DNA polymerase-3 subunit delta'